MLRELPFIEGVLYKGMRYPSFFIPQKRYLFHNAFDITSHELEKHY
jgi:hypothetical protein